MSLAAARSPDHDWPTRRPDRQGKSATSTTSATSCVIVATDRISAFDYVLGSGIPDKGKVLSQMSVFWFGRTRRHRRQPSVVQRPGATIPPRRAEAAELLRGRSMLVRRAEPLPIECVARGYLSGSGWKDYVASGEVCGHPTANRTARVRSAAR